MQACTIYQQGFDHRSGYARRWHVTIGLEPGNLLSLGPSHEGKRCLCSLISIKFRELQGTVKVTPSSGTSRNRILEAGGIDIESSKHSSRGLWHIPGPYEIIRKCLSNRAILAAAKIVSVRLCHTFTAPIYSCGRLDSSFSVLCQVEICASIQAHLISNVA